MENDVGLLFINNYANTVINGNIISGKKQEKGFINSDCNYINNMLSNIALHAVENYNIFNKSRCANLGHLISALSYA